MYTPNSLSKLAFMLVASLSVYASPIAEDAKLESRATIDCGGPSENYPNMSLMQTDTLIGSYRFLTASQEKGYDFQAPS
jgi:hypothetical protein